MGSLPLAIQKKTGTKEICLLEAMLTCNRNMLKCSSVNEVLIREMSGMKLLNSLLHACTLPFVKISFMVSSRQTCALVQKQAIHLRYEAI